MFFTMTHATAIHFKRTQDFSRLIEVFANNFDIMYPERPEAVPSSVSLDELEKEIVWRGSPFISVYSFLAGHDRQLGELRRAVRNHFLIMMLGPWLLTIAVVGLSVTLLSQAWEQVQPFAVVLGALSAASVSYTHLTLPTKRIV